MDVESQISVLIVDDDVADLRALQGILSKNYKIYLAKSGKSAIRRAVENRPDIILLDVVMPDMDGHEVAAVIKKTAGVRDIPIIFITARGEVEDELAGFDSGAVDYITKPFNSAIVEARVKTHLKTAIRLTEQDTAGLLLKKGRAVRSVLFQDLLYVDVVKHTLSFHLADGEVVMIRASLTEYEDRLLADPRFARSHVSFIVNMDYVASAEARSMLLRNGERLSISQSYSSFKTKFIAWQRGER